MKKYAVITESGLIVFESDSKRTCNAYLKQAYQKGAKPNSLTIIKSRELTAML